jgi:hypothetical protein
VRLKFAGYYRLFRQCCNEQKVSDSVHTCTAYPLEPGSDLATEATKGSPTMTPKGPGSPVPRAVSICMISPYPEDRLLMLRKLTY